jgi:hypothetical protein
VVRLLAAASESQAVSQTQVWDNGVKLGVYGVQVDDIYDLSPGQHATTVLDLDASYNILHLYTTTYSVQPLVNGLQLVTPSPGELVYMTAVHVLAHANESVAINQMQVWDNGVKLGWYPGADVDQYFNLAPGLHTVTVLDLDGNYNVLHQSSASYSVQ